MQASLRAACDLLHEMRAQLHADSVRLALSAIVTGPLHFDGVIITRGYLRARHP